MIITGRKNKKLNHLLSNFLNTITHFGMIDLHCHSTASDGSDSPDNIYNLARNNKLLFFSLTDHDTMSGVEVLLKKNISIDNDFIQNDIIGKDLSGILDSPLRPSPLFVPGVELSVFFEGQNVHLLGYFIGEDILKLKPFLETQRQARSERNMQMIERLHELGFDIPKDYLSSQKEGKSKGRVDVAKWLVQNGICKDISEAFNSFLGEGKPAYVPRKIIELEDAAKQIIKCNGVPVIAHPHLYGWCENEGLAYRKIHALQSAYAIGVEVFHSDATIENQKLLKSIALKLNVPITAGSDYHGINKKDHDLYSSHSKFTNFYKK